jgi:hypothetical protein
MEQITEKERRRIIAEYKAEQRQEKRATRQALQRVSLYPARPRWCARVARHDRASMIKSTQAMIENLAALDLYAVLCIVGRLTEWKPTKKAR